MKPLQHSIGFYASLIIELDAVKTVKMRGVGNRGLSAPVLALILLVVGVAIALIAAAMTGGFLFGWGASPRVTVEKVDILVNPVAGTGFVTVDVRNSGGALLTGCAVDLLDSNGATIIALTGPTDLRPGQIGTFTASGVAGINSGEIYITRAQCTGPNNINVSDQKSAVAHI